MRRLVELNDNYVGHAPEDQDETDDHREEGNDRVRQLHGMSPRLQERDDGSPDRDGQHWTDDMPDDLRSPRQTRWRVRCERRTLPLTRRTSGSQENCRGGKQGVHCCCCGRLALRRCFRRTQAGCEGISNVLE